MKHSIPLLIVDWRTLKRLSTQVKRHQMSMDRTSTQRQRNWLKTRRSRGS